ncbi:MAG: thiamine phosphate synthase [Actinomycetota bacterium]
MSYLDARLYLVAPARLEAGWLHELVDELVDAGVDIVQLREKTLEARDVMRLAEPIVAACRASSVPFIVNDRPDVALALGADGVHVGQNDVPVAVARRVLPAGVIGLSTHSEPQVDAAASARDRSDYIAVGPVYATPTKEGRPAAGLGVVAHAARRADAPWFAIGGIDKHNLSEVLATGARRIVVVRAIARAPDPPAAAAELRALLDEVAL